MKRIVVLLIVLFGLFQTTFSQSGLDYELDETQPIITDVEQLSSPWNAPHFYEGDLSHLLDNDPETYWHTDWNNTTDRHYVQVMLNEPVNGLISMKYVRRWHNYNSQNLCTKDHVTKWGIYGSNTPDAKEADWELLLLDDAPYHSPGETRNTVGFETKGFIYLRIYAEDTDTHKHYWHCAEIQLYPCTKADDYTVAVNELSEVFIAYESYEAPFLKNVGTKAGQYSEESVQAFIQALNDANKALDPREEKPTVEALKSCAEAIKTAYQAVLDSEVPFTLADGYYRIRHSCVFVNNMPTGEIDEDGNPVIQEQEVSKYMYSVLEGEKINARWNTPAASAPACPYIWKVTNSGGYFDIMNCATDSRFNEVPKDSYVTMSPEATNLMAADLVHNVNGDPHVTLRVSTQLGTDHTFLHPLSHGIQASTNMGNGTDGYIIGWANDQYGVSEWVFEPVSEEEAQAAIVAYEPYKSRAVMIEQFKLMRDDVKGKLEKAKDLSIQYNQEKPYITDVDQLSSLWNAPHEYEGNLEHLIDNDPVTYWHTDWNNNTDWHYLQVSLNEPVYDMTVMRVVRRKYLYNSQNLCTADHVTLWGIYGADEPDAEDEEWEELAQLPTPYTAPGEELLALFNPQGKQYLRFVALSTISGKRYWHAAELQLYPGEILDPVNSQFHQMGTVATTMEARYNELKDIDADAITIEQYAAFKDAYDDFIVLFVDPTPLREKIESSKDAGAIIRIGADPGFWKDNSVSEKLAKTLSDATDYDKAGKYTSEKSEAFIKSLDEAVANIKVSANPVQTGKWYRFRFGTEQEYADYKWVTDGNDAQYRTHTEDGVTETLGILNEAIFGKYMTVAKSVLVDEEDDEGEYTRYIVQPMEKGEAAIDNQLYFDDLKDITDPDMALFRFVSLGDSAYIIQNKATGLYLQKKIENNDGIYLSPHPSLFTQEIAGYGQNAFFIKTLSNEAQNPLHFARNKNVVVTYGSWGDRDGRRGCFFVEEVGNVAADYAENTARMKVWEGEMTARCYPVSMTVVDEKQGTMWSVASIDKDDEDLSKVTVTLYKLDQNTAKAGQPFIYVKGDYDDLEEHREDDEPAFALFTIGSDVVAKPQNKGPLKGLFTRTTIGQGVLTVNAADVECTTSESVALNTNAAYIADEESIPGTAVLKLDFDEDSNSISSVLQKVSKGGRIYTLDGRFVKYGNLNSLQGLKKGTYIIDNIKIVVQ